MTRVIGVPWRGRDNDAIFSDVVHCPNQQTWVVGMRDAPPTSRQLAAEFGVQPYTDWDEVEDFPVYAPMRPTLHQHDGEWSRPILEEG